jgi:hypothetical protein
MTNKHAATAMHRKAVLILSTSKPVHPTKPVESSSVAMPMCKVGATRQAGAGNLVPLARFLHLICRNVQLFQAVALAVLW